MQQFCTIRSGVKSKAHGIDATAQIRARAFLKG